MDRKNSKRFLQSNVIIIVYRPIFFYSEIIKNFLFFKKECRIFMENFTLKRRLNTDTSPSNFGLVNFSGEWLDRPKKEKPSGTRNCDTFATVLFFFCSVSLFPRKLNQTSLSQSFSPCASPGNTPSVISLPYNCWYKCYNSKIEELRKKNIQKGWKHC